MLIRSIWIVGCVTPHCSGRVWRVWSRMPCQSTSPSSAMTCTVAASMRWAASRPRRSHTSSSHTRPSVPPPAERPLRGTQPPSRRTGPGASAGKVRGRMNGSGGAPPRNGGHFSGHCGRGRGAASPPPRVSGRNRGVVSGAVAPGGTPDRMQAPTPPRARAIAQSRDGLPRKADPVVACCSESGASFSDALTTSAVSLREPLGCFDDAWRSPTHRGPP